MTYDLNLKVIERSEVKMMSINTTTPQPPPLGVVVATVFGVNLHVSRTPLSIPENRFEISIAVRKLQRVQTDRPTEHSHKAAPLLISEKVSHFKRDCSIKKPGSYFSDHKHKPQNL